jgi:NADPH2:quinone reductase
MKSVQIDQLSDDFSRVRVVDAPIPEPADGQVRVRMHMCPVNPSDRNFIHGDYRRALERLIWNRGQAQLCYDPARKQSLPNPPYALGGEGVGTVDACGSGLLARRLAGKRVAIAAGPPMGAWQEYTVVDAKKALPVPDALSDEQAAMYIVNPLSAYAMVHEVLRVKRGSWLLQDAAGSALAAMVIRMSKAHGFKTINVVRSSAHMQALESLGADVVINTESQDLIDEVAHATGGRGVEYAMDCVGGELAGQLLQCLTLNGHMVAFGTLADTPISLPSRDMMMPVTRLSGFFALNWLAMQPPLKLLSVLRRLRKLAVKGVFDVPVRKTYPPDQVSEALTASVEPGQPGKVLLKFGN